MHFLKMVSLNRVLEEVERIPLDIRATVQKFLEISLSFSFSVTGFTGLKEFVAAVSKAFQTDVVLYGSTGLLLIETAEGDREWTPKAVKDIDLYCTAAFSLPAWQSVMKALFCTENNTIPEISGLLATSDFHKLAIQYLDTRTPSVTTVLVATPPDSPKISLRFAEPECIVPPYDGVDHRGICLTRAPFEVTFFYPDKDVARFMMAKRRLFHDQIDSTSHIGFRWALREVREGFVPFSFLDAYRVYCRIQEDVFRQNTENPFYLRDRYKTHMSHYPESETRGAEILKDAVTFTSYVSCFSTDRSQVTFLWSHLLVSLSENRVLPEAVLAKAGTFEDALKYVYNQYGYVPHLIKNASPLQELQDLAGIAPVGESLRLWQLWGSYFIARCQSLYARYSASEIMPSVIPQQPVVSDLILKKSCWASFQALLALPAFMAVCRSVDRQDVRRLAVTAQELFSDISDQCTPVLLSFCRKLDMESGDFSAFSLPFSALQLMWPHDRVVHPARSLFTCLMCPEPQFKDALMVAFSPDFPAFLHRHIRSLGDIFAIDACLDTDPLHIQEGSALLSPFPDFFLYMVSCHGMQGDGRVFANTLKALETDEALDNPVKCMALKRFLVRVVRYGGSVPLRCLEEVSGFFSRLSEPFSSLPLMVCDMGLPSGSVWPDRIMVWKMLFRVNRVLQDAELAEDMVENCLNHYAHFISGHILGTTDLTETATWEQYFPKPPKKPVSLPDLCWQMMTKRPDSSLLPALFEIRALAAFSKTLMADAQFDERLAAYFCRFLKLTNRQPVYSLVLKVLSNMPPDAGCFSRFLRETLPLMTDAGLIRQVFAVWDYGYYLSYEDAAFLFDHFFSSPHQLILADLFNRDKTFFLAEFLKLAAGNAERTMSLPDESTRRNLFFLLDVLKECVLNTVETGKLLDTLFTRVKTLPDSSGLSYLVSFELLVAVAFFAYRSGKSDEWSQLLREKFAGFLSSSFFKTVRDADLAGDVYRVLTTYVLKKYSPYFLISATDAAVILERLVSCNSLVFSTEKRMEFGHHVLSMMKDHGWKGGLSDLSALSTVYYGGFFTLIHKIPGSLHVYSAYRLKETIKTHGLWLLTEMANRAIASDKDGAIFFVAAGHYVATLTGSMGLLTDVPLPDKLPKCRFAAWSGCLERDGAGAYLDFLIAYGTATGWPQELTDDFSAFAGTAARFFKEATSDIKKATAVQICLTGILSASSLSDEKKEALCFFFFSTYPGFLVQCPPRLLFTILTMAAPYLQETSTPLEDFSSNSQSDIPAETSRPIHKNNRRKQEQARSIAVLLRAPLYHYLSASPSDTFVTDHSGSLVILFTYFFLQKDQSAGASETCALLLFERFLAKTAWDSAASLLSVISPYTGEPANWLDALMTSKSFSAPNACFYGALFSFIRIHLDTLVTEHRSKLERLWLQVMFLKFGLHEDWPGVTLSHLRTLTERVASDRKTEGLLNSVFYKQMDDKSAIQALFCKWLLFCSAERNGVVWSAKDLYYLDSPQEVMRFILSRFSSVMPLAGIYVLCDIQRLQAELLSPALYRSCFSALQPEHFVLIAIHNPEMLDTLASGLVKELFTRSGIGHYKTVLHKALLSGPDGWKGALAFRMNTREAADKCGIEESITLDTALFKEFQVKKYEAHLPKGFSFLSYFSYYFSFFKESPDGKTTTLTVNSNLISSVNAVLDHYLSLDPAGVSAFWLACERYQLLQKMPSGKRFLYFYYYCKTLPHQVSEHHAYLLPFFFKWFEKNESSADMVNFLSKNDYFGICAAVILTETEKKLRPVFEKTNSNSARKAPASDAYPVHFKTFLKVAGKWPVFRSSFPFIGPVLIKMFIPAYKDQQKENYGFSFASSPPPITGLALYKALLQSLADYTPAPEHTPALIAHITEEEVLMLARYSGEFAQLVMDETPLVGKLAEVFRHHSSYHTSHPFRDVTRKLPLMVADHSGSMEGSLIRQMLSVMPRNRKPLEKNALSYTDLCKERDLQALNRLLRRKDQVNSPQNGIYLLNEAVKHLWKEGVAALLQAGAKTYLADELGNTSLHLAANCPEILTMLLEHVQRQDAVLDMFNMERATPMTAAVQYGNLECVRLFHSKGASFLVPCASGLNSVQLAVACGHLDITIFFLEKANADPHMTTLDGKTLLHFAAQFGFLPLLEVVAGYFSNMDVQDKLLNTPLHLCVLSIQPDIHGFSLQQTSLIKFDRKADSNRLLCLKWFAQEKHGDFSARNSENETPFQVAVRYDHSEEFFAFLARQLSTGSSNPEYGFLFFEAVRYSNLPAIQALLKFSIDVNGVYGENGRTALHEAVLGGEVSVVSLLLENKASFTQADKDGFHVLHHAATTSEEMITYLLNRPECSPDCFKGFSPLHVAAREGYPVAVRVFVTFLQRHNHSLAFWDPAGMTALHYAAAHGHKDVTTFLLNYIPVESQTVDGYTPLSVAVANQRPEVVDLLLRTGKADANPPNSDPTPMHFAVLNDDSRCVLFLLLKAGKLDCPGKYGRTPLHLAAMRGNKDVLKVIGTRGRYDLADSLGNTPVHYLAVHALQEMLDLLKPVLKAALCMANNNLQTPLMVAIQNRRAAMAEKLIEMMNFVNQVDSHGYSALHYASYYGLHAVVVVLLKKGALNIPSLTGVRPLDIARLRKDAKLVQLLESLDKENEPLFSPKERVSLERLDELFKKVFF